MLLQTAEAVASVNAIRRCPVASSRAEPSVRWTYLHFDMFERISTSGPRLPRDAVQQSVGHVAAGVVTAIEVGHVAAVIPPCAGEPPRTAAVLELLCYIIVVDVEGGETASAVLQQ